MFKLKLSERLVKAAENSPDGILELDVAYSLRLAGNSTLKTTLSRLAKGERLIRLKRGAYSTNPMLDAFICAQTVFPGYIGFGSALYLHHLISEIPFEIFVATKSVSAIKEVGAHDFHAVAMGELAIGFERLGRRLVSTKAKTLFDCAYLPRYSPGIEKLASAYSEEPLTKKEWEEFDSYCRRFCSESAGKRLAAAKAALLKGVKK